MKKRYAVIDLGTNTFHLLIVEKDPTTVFKELFRKRIFIKLAENGIEKIGDAPFERGIKALKQFKEIIDSYQVSNVKSFGTAGLRTASNGPDFIQRTFEETGIEVQLIPGEREAHLIYKGVSQAVDLKENTALIMDIGGGSVEFILADNIGVKWAQSFPVGAAVLFNNFHQNDPISSQEVTTLLDYLNQTLNPLKTQLKKYTPAILIGASGTFDVLEALLCPKKLTAVHGIVRVENFQPLYEQLLKTNLQERLDMPGIPDSRAEMIIVALILIQFILDQAPIHTISVSAYAMKEGMLSELID